MAERLGRDEAGNIWVIDAQGNPIRPHNASPAIGPAIGNSPKLPGELTAQGLSNQNTGVNLRVNRATEAAQVRQANAQADQATNQARVVGINPSFDREKELRSAFEAQPAVQAYKDAAASLGIMLQTPDTGGGDIQIIYNYIKSQGPGPVAQGELELAQSVASFRESLEQQYGKLTSSNRLPKRVRRELVEASRQAVAVKRAQFDQVYAQFRSEADRNGLNAESVTGRHPADAIRPAEEKYIRQHGQAPHSAQTGQPVEAAAPNAKFVTQNNPERAAFIDAMVRNSVPFDRAQEAYRQQYPGAPVFENRAKWNEAVQFARRHPNASGSFGQSLDQVSLNQTEQDRNALGQTGAGQAATLYLNAATGGLPSLLAGQEGQQTVQGARDAMGGWSLIPEGLGALTGTLGATKALGMGANALKEAPLIGGPFNFLANNPAARMMTADIGYGGAFGAAQNPDNPLAGAALGAGAGAAGNVIGSKVIAPGIRAGANALGFNPAPALSRADDMIAGQALKANPEEVMGRMQEAVDLRMPFTLADADPRFRALGGSVVRKSPDAYANAQAAIGSRTGGQAERALGTIDRHLTPAGDINAIKNAEIAAAREAAAPLYESSYATVVPQTPQLNALLNTPAGRAALARARTIAANEGRDPSSMGFALDADGGVVLHQVNMNLLDRQAAARNGVREAQNAFRRAKRAKGGDVDGARAQVQAAQQELRAANSALKAAPTPETAQTMPTYSTQTLDYVKRGLDDILEQYRDPVTREMRLDEAGRAIQGVRQSLLAEVDRLNPDYAAARSAYQQRASRATDADRGYKATGPRVLPETVSGIASGLGPENLAMYRQGFTSSLADTIENTRMSANPYERVFGSPAQQAKMTTLFPEGAPNFARARGIETEMTATNRELFGGSPTQPRAEADKLFDGGALGDVIDFGLNVATGTPPISAARSQLAAGRGMFGAARDTFRLGMGRSAKERADELAPLLFNPDAEANLAALADLVAAKRAREEFVRRTGMFGAGIGAPLAISLSQ